MPFLRHIVKYPLRKWVFPLVYKWSARKPIDENLILFADESIRPKMRDNLRYMWDLCQEAGYDCIFMTPNSYKVIKPKVKRLFKHLAFDIKFVALFARARAVFLVDYFPLVDTVKKRKETDLVQLWHGCGIFKRWGYASVETEGFGATEKELKRYPRYLNNTLVSVSSPHPWVREGYAFALNCDMDVIKPLGTPRTDFYFDESKVEGAYRKLVFRIPDIAKKKVLLYAPTFRGHSLSASYMEKSLDYQKLKEDLGEDWICLVKFHPEMRSNGPIDELEGFLFDVSDLGPEEVLPFADVLVTDYSSIMFEYSFFTRPIISYAFDLDEYDFDRGFFHPFEEITPGPIVKTQEELTEAIKSAGTWFSPETIKAFNKKFMGACDGHSAERVFKYVFGRSRLEE